MIKKIVKKLADSAKEKDICEEWLEALKKIKSENDLYEMYFKGIDFCLSSNFPSVEFMTTHFKDCNKNGIHIDKVISLMNPRKIVTFGYTSGTVDINDYNISELFVKDYSSILLITGGKSFAVVDMFDNSILKVISSGESKVLVNRYKGNNKLETEALGRSYIKVIEKTKTTY
jgi:hypothetical protein